MVTPTQTTLPLAPPAAASATDTAPDYVQVMLDLAAQAAQRQAMGTRLSREELKAIREAALFQARDTHWSDRAACAEALGLTGKQLEALIAAGAPVPPHAPVPMIPLLRWYVQHLRAGGAVGVDTVAQAASLADQADAEDLRFRRLKNDRLEGTMVHEAESAAMQALADVVRDLKAVLIYAVPEQVAERLTPDADRRTRIRTIRTALATALTEAARKAGALADIETAVAAANAADPAPEPVATPKPKRRRKTTPEPTP